MSISATLSFARIDSTPLTGAPLVCYRAENRHWDCEIWATAAGVLVLGSLPMLTTEGCVAFEETLAKARVQHNHIAQGNPPLAEEEVDRILGPIPLYEVAA